MPEDELRRLADVFARRPQQPAPEVEAAPASGAFLVDRDPRPGQITKQDFLAQLRAAVTTAAAEELEGTDWTVEHCPWLDYWFSYYEGRGAASVEEAVRKYARQSRNALDATDYVEPVVARVRQAIQRWRVTGEIDAPGGVDPMRRADGATIASGSLAQLGDGERPTLTGEMASVLGSSVGDATIHTDAAAARLADNADALAFTIGSHVVYSASAPRPGTLAGDALLAHELAHVQQQAAAPPTREITTTPDATSEANADAAVTSIAAARFGLPGLARQAWSAVSSPLALQRCSNKDNDTDLDTQRQLAEATAELRDLRAADSTAKTFDAIAIQETKREALEHWVATLAGGKGKRTGLISTDLKKDDNPNGFETCDCTDYVKRVLALTFAKVGKKADWERIRKKAIAINPLDHGKPDIGLNGLELQNTLMDELGWKSVYWAPDPDYEHYRKRKRDANDQFIMVDGHYVWEDDDEASSTYREARKKKYGEVDLGKKRHPIRVDEMAIKYRSERANPDGATPVDSATVQDLSGIEKLEKIPFAVLTARGGKHMSLVIYGMVYEVHYDKTVDNVHLYERKLLRDWGWNSGLIVAPAEDVNAAFKKK